MLARFSLYGFLKNQRYFEPFLLLILLEKGLSFFAIGLLIGFRELTINVLEIPSGAVADLYGRRRSMVVSFAAYLGSFALFAEAEALWILFVAMALFACGDAFRSGTHKAIILDWLRQQGRSDEKTRVYGLTRSWSKTGSALSALVAAALVLLSGANGYSRIFWFSTLPYVLNLLNLATYPASLDGAGHKGGALRTVWKHLRSSVRGMRKRGPLRRLVGESMGYDGVYGAVKDYLQPTLGAAAVALPVLLGLQNRQRTAILVGLTYGVLHLLSAAASRRAHRVADAAGGEAPASRRLWAATGVTYLFLLGFLWLGWYGGAIATFVGLAILQNLWRPILVARFDTGSDPHQGATVLSVEAQAKSVATMLLAPLLGATVDLISRGGETVLWPIAVPGLVTAGWALLMARAAAKGRVSY